MKDLILKELERVKNEIDANNDQERATLEGWEEALLWVLKVLDDHNS